MVINKINSSSSLVLKEGILANDDILSYEEFREFILEKIDESFLRSFLTRLG
jgi:flagellar assembly factor FliW